MAEVHVTVSSNIGASYQVHNPGQHPLPAGAGQPVVAAVKPVGNPNGTAHGQVASGPVFHNPA